MVKKMAPSCRICLVLFVLAVGTFLLQVEGRTVAQELKDNPQPTVKVNNGKFVQDPFMFYRWPGFAQIQGLDGRFYNHPVIVVTEKQLKTKEDELREKEKAQDDEEEAEDDEDDWEEDDEPDDYLPPPEPHYKPWKKLKYVSVSSFGVSPPIEDKHKATWWGVLNTRARNGLVEIEDADGDFSNDDIERAEDESEEDFEEAPYQAMPKRVVRRWLYHAPLSWEGHDAEGDPWIINTPRV